MGPRALLLTVLHGLQASTERAHPRFMPGMEAPRCQDKGVCGSDFSRLSVPTPSSPLVPLPQPRASSSSQVNYRLSRMTSTVAVLQSPSPI